MLGLQAAVRQAIAGDMCAPKCCLQGHLKKFKEEIQELGNKILQAALALHDRVSSTFRKTAVNFHYEVRAVAVDRVRDWPCHSLTDTLCVPCAVHGAALGKRLPGPADGSARGCQHVSC